MYSVDCIGVSRCFGDVATVNRVTLRMDEATIVNGPSGSGKTTLLRLIAGLEVPDDGEIRINGSLVSGPSLYTPPADRGISFMFQSPALWPHMTVAQNIRFSVDGMNRDTAYRRVTSLLAALSLEGLTSRYPSQLSGGEARRVALARALAPIRPVLLLDEPFQNLNEELKTRMAEVIRTHLDESGALLILVSHDGGDRLARKTVYMEQGTARVVA